MSALYENELMMSSVIEHDVGEHATSVSETPAQRHASTIDDITMCERESDTLRGVLPPCDGSQQEVVVRTLSMLESRNDLVSMTSGQFAAALDRDRRRKVFGLRKMGVKKRKPARTNWNLMVRAALSDLISTNARTCVAPAETLVRETHGPVKRDWNLDKRAKEMLRGVRTSSYWNHVQGKQISLESPETESVSPRSVTLEALGACSASTDASTARQSNVRTDIDHVCNETEAAIIARRTGMLEALPLSQCNDVELAYFCTKNSIWLRLPTDYYQDYHHSWWVEARRVHGAKKGRTRGKNIKVTCGFVRYDGDRRELTLADTDWETKIQTFDVSRYKSTKSGELTLRDLVTLTYPDAQILHDLCTVPTKLPVNRAGVVADSSSARLEEERLLSVGSNVTPSPPSSEGRPVPVSESDTGISEGTSSALDESSNDTEKEQSNRAEEASPNGEEHGRRVRPETKEQGTQADEMLLKPKIDVFASESQRWGPSITRVYSKVDQRELLHARLGHVNKKKVEEVLRRREPKLDSNGKKISAFPEGDRQWIRAKCDCCQMNKAMKVRHHSKSQGKRRATKFLERIHMDESGEMSVPSYNGARYYTVFVDEFTRTKWTYLQRDKTEALQVLQMFLIDAEIEAKNGETVRSIRVDQAAEHLSDDYLAFLQRRGIKLQCSCARNHWQNGIAEKAIRDVAEMSRCMLNFAQAPRDLWGYAMRYATFVQNRVPSDSLYDPTLKRTVSPYEKRTGMIPDLKELKVFGCQATIPYEKGDGYVLDHKLDERGVLGMFLGRSEDGLDLKGAGVKGDIVWTLEAGPRVIVTAEATFDECTFPQLLGPVQWHISLETGYKSDVPCKDWSELSQCVDGVPFFMRPGEVPDGYDDQGVLGHVVTRVKDGVLGILYRYDKWKKKWIIKYPSEEEIVSTEMLEKDRQLYVIGKADRVAMRRYAIDEDVKEQKRIQDRLNKAKQKYEKAETERKRRLGIVDETERRLKEKEEKRHAWLRKEQGVRQRTLRTSEGFIPNDDDDKYDDEREDLLMNERFFENMARKYKKRPDNGEKIHLRKLRSDQAPIQSRIYTPNNYRQAISCPEAEMWKDAIRKEIQGLLDRGVFEFVNPDRSKRSIDSKLVFKVKYNPDGTVDKYKARYVVRGDRQRKGIDFDEIFAPVSHHALARTLLSVACALDMEIHLCDISQAFLYADLEEEVYMRPAAGITDVMGVPPDTWLKLKKSLYGLKQAPRNWNLEFNRWLKGEGFDRCGEDDCLYAREQTVNGEEVVILLLEYVDDFIMVSNNLEALQDFKDDMMKKYAHNNGGDISYYLGVEIERDRKNKTLKLHQTKYTQDLLEGVLETKKLVERDTPLSPGIKLLKHSGEPVEQGWYRSVIGTCIYLSGWTRPDISYAVSELAAHVSNPGPEHHRQLLHLLGYLKKTIGLSITYSGNLRGSEYKLNELVGFCDASFAGNPETWKSRTGFVMMLNGGPISWKSKPQSLVALSTTDAEIEAAVRAVREVLGLRGQLFYLGLEQQNPTTLHEDNAATIHISINASLREATKHLGYRRAFLRDHHYKRSVVLRPIATSEQTADIFTKSLSRIIFERHRNELVR